MAQFEVEVRGIYMGTHLVEANSVEDAHKKALLLGDPINSIKLTHTLKVETVYAGDEASKPLIAEYYDIDIEDL